MTDPLVAVAVIGGLITSFIMELLVYPPIYKLWKKNTDLRSLTGAGLPAPHHINNQQQ